MALGSCEFWRTKENYYDEYQYDSHQASHWLSSINMSFIYVCVSSEETTLHNWEPLKQIQQASHWLSSIHRSPKDWTP